MKKQLFILGTLLLLVIASSCNKDDDHTDPIVGKWEVFKVIEFDKEEPCSDYFIEFYNDGTAEVSGYTDDGHETYNEIYFEQFKVSWSRIDKMSVKVDYAEEGEDEDIEIFIKDGDFYYTKFEDTETDIIEYYKRI